MDVKSLALANLIFQIMLMGAVVYAGYLAKSRRELQRHCTVMRIIVPLLIISVLSVMLPSLMGYTAKVTFSWFTVELFIHLTLGLGVIGLWVFVNLAQSGIIKVKHRLLPYMRTAFILWVVGLIMGSHIYLVLYA